MGSRFLFKDQDFKVLFWTVNSHTKRIGHNKKKVPVAPNSMMRAHICRLVADFRNKKANMCSNKKKHSHAKKTEEGETRVCV